MNVLRSVFRPSFQLLAAAAAVLAASTVLACNVPVFRYALEHWQPDQYRGIVFHKGPLSDDAQAQIRQLTAGTPTPKVNIAVRTVDLAATPEPADAELAKLLTEGALPQLIIQYPARQQIEAILWQGPLASASLATLGDSPARQEILKRLIAGQTAVWLQIDLGDSSKDDPAALVLESELKTLEKTLKLPERTDAPEDAIGDGPELRVEFSILRINRQDPAERALVSMLMNAEEDLAVLPEPLVFPVFGRGRALLPLVGPGITPDNIRGSARFLAGACSCQVKEQNPGFDLLLTADWNLLIPWAKSPVGAAAQVAAGPPELVPIATGSKPAESVPASIPPSPTEIAPAATSKSEGAPSAEDGVASTPAATSGFHGND